MWVRQTSGIKRWLSTATFRNPWIPNSFLQAELWLIQQRRFMHSRFPEVNRILAFCEELLGEIGIGNV